MPLGVKKEEVLQDRSLGGGEEGKGEHVWEFNVERHLTAFRRRAEEGAGIRKRPM